MISIYTQQDSPSAASPEYAIAHNAAEEPAIARSGSTGARAGLVEQKRAASVDDRTGLAVLSVS